MLHDGSSTSLREEGKGASSCSLQHRTPVSPVVLTAGRSRGRRQPGQPHRTAGGKGKDGSLSARRVHRQTRVGGGGMTSGSNLGLKCDTGYLLSVLCGCGICCGGGYTIYLYRLSLHSIDIDYPYRQQTIQ